VPKKIILTCLNNTQGILDLLRNLKSDLYGIKYKFNGKLQICHTKFNYNFTILS